MSEDLARQLLDLFPSSGATHITWRPGTNGGGKKRVKTEKRPARAADYARHVCAGSFEGVGAVGATPVGFDAARGMRGGRWLALDLDALPMERLLDSALPETLASLDIHVYATRGSTGRGSHLLARLDEPLEQAKLHEGVKRLGQLVQDATGITKLETFPSHPRNDGARIFLPYRGAARDEYGFNPLHELVPGLPRVALPEAAGRFRQTSPAALLALEPVKSRRPRKAAPDLALEPNQGAVPAEEAFEREVARVAATWRESRRNNLTMGFSAYACVALRVPGQRILDAVRGMPGGERENAPFVDVARQTIWKASGGLRVAWHPYYEAAGIASPPRVREHPQRREYLARIAARLEAGPWYGRGALAELAVYRSLYALAVDFGRVHEHGIAVSISRRDLAMRADLSDTGQKGALRRLKSAGLVIVPPQRKSPHAGILVLAVPANDCRNQPQSSLLEDLQQETVPEWVSIQQHVAFRQGALGRLGGQIVAQLVRQPEGALSRPALGRALSRPPSRLTAALERLEANDIITIDRDAILLNEGLSENLDAAAARLGVFVMRAKQRDRHDVDRAAYKRAVALRKAA